MATKKVEQEHSIRYDYVKSKYPRGVTIVHARKYVSIKALYDWEFEEITGQPYEA